MRELLGFEENTAGAMMTTEFIVVGESATVEGAIAALKHFEGPLESVNSIYLVNADGALTGSVPVPKLLLADSQVPLKHYVAEAVISLTAHANQTEVVDLFHKYNLLALPVVDDRGHLLGVITADDVLELVTNRK